MLKGHEHFRTWPTEVAQRQLSICYEFACVCRTNKQSFMKTQLELMHKNHKELNFTPCIDIKLMQSQFFSATISKLRFNDSSRPKPILTRRMSAKCPLEMEHYSVHVVILEHPPRQGLEVVTEEDEEECQFLTFLIFLL